MEVAKPDARTPVEKRANAMVNLVEMAIMVDKLMIV